MKKIKRRIAILLVFMLVAPLVLQPTMNVSASNIDSTGIVGDANGEDDTANIKDLVRLMRYVQGDTEDICSEVDLNKDGTVNSKELPYLRALLIGAYQTKAATETLQVGMYDADTFTVNLTPQQLQIVGDKELASVTVGESEFSTQSYSDGSLTLDSATLGSVGKKTIAATFTNSASEIAVVTFDVNVYTILSKTVKPSDSEFTYEGAYNKAELSQDGESLYVELTSSKPSFILHSFDGMLTAGNVYEFTVKMQDEANASSNLITMMARKSGGGSLRTVNAKKTVTAEGKIEYKTQICWPEGGQSIVLYWKEGTFKGNITSIDVKDKTAIKTAITNGGATVTANDGTLTYGGAPYTAVSVAGEEGAKTLNVKLNSSSPSVYLHSFTDMLVAGTKYELKIVATEATGTTPQILMMDKNLTQLKDSSTNGIAYSLSASSIGGKSIYSTTFTAPENSCALLLYWKGSSFEASIESTVLVDMNSGYTVKPGDFNFIYEGSYNKAEMSQDGESLYVELTNSKPSFILHSFDGMLQAGNVYEFTVKMQDETNASSNLITMMARNGNWTVKAKKTVTAEGWIEYKTQICWPENATSFVLYSQDGTFKGNIVSIGVVDKTAIKTAITNGGATVTANDGTLTYGGAPYTAVSVAGEEGAKTLNVKLNTTSPSVYLHSFTDMLVAGTEYELKIVTAGATGATPQILMVNNNLAQLKDSGNKGIAYTLTKTTEGDKTVYTATFTAPEGGCALLLYRNGADFEGNIESVTLEET